METLPAAPLRVLALEIELPESTLSVWSGDCIEPKVTEPAPFDVKDAAEMVPPLTNDKEPPSTTTLPPMPLLSTPAMARMPVENCEAPVPSISSDPVLTST